MEITTTEYSVKYDPEADTIYLQGTLLLYGQEYQPIRQFLEQVTALSPVLLKLNLRQLKALNSSGISMLGRFVFALDQKKNIQLILECSHKIAWQEKWAKNFQLLMPRLTLEWE
ncbi:hypothetical protein THIOM_000496 [Candidatus Thiomargarita nelsonii]|uniref:STAS domain-containing protein n=1 Tax=Candidatus Thiomargarita nelsonii TaxID=1003181 RepID=A0A176S6G0_9GAMM|nr:hypothetical protein THIOM_000496 [Candidatus Thiomargarita nelsonii]